MHILLITPYYAPDLGPSSPLVAMLCEDLVALGHTVEVLAAVPHFPTGAVPAAYRGRLWQTETRNGVQVHRVWVPEGDRSRLVHRALVFAIYQVLSAAAGLMRRCDALIILNPALETWLPFAVLSTLRGKPAIFGVWDVYPDVGVRLGIFRQRAVVALVGALEDFCLRGARAVQVLSNGFIPPLVGRGVPPEKLVLIPPWLDTDFHRPVPRRNPFSNEAGLDERFVVLYAGNLGHSQGLEHVLEAACAFRADDQVRFVFVGDGAQRAALQEQARQMELSNVLFLPFQPRERLPDVLATADVALVSLRAGVGQDSLPSKTFPLLASGRPIVAAVDEGCETWNLVQRAGAGLCVAPETPAQLVQALHVLRQDAALCAHMGQCGRAYALRHHDRRIAAQAFDDLLNQLVKGYQTA